MNKSIRLVSVGLAAFALALSLVACEPPESEGGGDDGNTHRPGAMSATGRRLKSVTVDYEQVFFTYDTEGRVAAMTHHEGRDSYSMHYRYSPDSIVATLYGNDTTEVAWRTVYSLTNGLITLATEYDNEGILKSKSPFRYQDNYLVSCLNKQIRWKHNDLSELVFDDTTTPFIDEHHVFTYSDKVANSKLELYLTGCPVDFALTMQGYFGHGSQHRLSQYHYADTVFWLGELFSNAYSNNISYTYDGYGDVASVLYVAGEGPATTLSLFDWE